jgi:hypothetical protein
MQASWLRDPPTESRVYRVHSVSGAVGSRGRSETKHLHQTNESVGSSEAQLMAPSVTQTTTLSTWVGVSLTPVSTTMQRKMSTQGKGPQSGDNGEWSRRLRLLYRLLEGAQLDSYHISPKRAAYPPCCARSPLEASSELYQDKLAVHYQTLDSMRHCFKDHHRQRALLPSKRSYCNFYKYYVHPWLGELLALQYCSSLAMIFL